MSIVKKMFRECGKDILNLAIKSTYPITGNLSMPVKEGLESIVKDFDAATATKTSFITNFIINPLAAYYLTKSSSMPNAIPNIPIIAASLTAVETLWRFVLTYLEKGEAIYPASIAGKIASLPIEYVMDLYERAKN